MVEEPYCYQAAAKALLASYNEYCRLHQASQTQESAFIGHVDHEAHMTLFRNKVAGDVGESSAQENNPSSLDGSPAPCFLLTIFAEWQTEQHPVEAAISSLPAPKYAIQEIQFMCKNKITEKRGNVPAIAVYFYNVKLCPNLNQQGQTGSTDEQWSLINVALVVLPPISSTDFRQSYHEILLRLFNFMQIQYLKFFAPTDLEHKARLEQGIQHIRTLARAQSQIVHQSPNHEFRHEAVRVLRCGRLDQVEMALVLKYWEVLLLDVYSSSKQKRTHFAPKKKDNSLL